MKKVITLILITLLLQLSYTFAEDQFPVELSPYPLTIDGTTIDTSISGLPIIKHNDMYYFPLSEAYANALGLNIDYNLPARITVTNTDVQGAVDPYEIIVPDQDRTSFATYLDVPLMLNSSHPYRLDAIFPVLYFRDTVYYPLSNDMRHSSLDWKISWYSDSGYNINTTITPESTNSDMVPTQPFNTSANSSLTEVTFINHHVKNRKNHHQITFDRSALPKSMRNFEYIAIDEESIKHEPFIHDISDESIWYKELKQWDSVSAIDVESYQNTLICLYDNKKSPLGYAYFEGYLHEGTIQLLFAPIPEPSIVPHMKTTAQLNYRTLKIPIDATYAALTPKWFDDQSTDFTINEVLSYNQHRYSTVKDGKAIIDTYFLQDKFEDFHLVLFDEDMDLIAVTDIDRNTHTNTTDSLGIDPLSLTETQHELIIQELLITDTPYAVNGTVRNSPSTVYENGVERMITWFENRFSRDYGNLNEDQFKVIFSQNFQSSTSQSYKGITDDPPLTADRITIDAYENQVISQCMFLTDDRLKFLAYDEYDRKNTFLRGRLFFKIDQHNSPSDFIDYDLKYNLSEIELELEEWYYVDIDMDFCIPLKYEWATWKVTDVGWRNWWEIDTIKKVNP